jgi:hypothetical protein
MQASRSRITGVALVVLLSAAGIVALAARSGDFGPAATAQPAVTSTHGSIVFGGRARTFELLCWRRRGTVRSSPPGRLGSGPGCGRAAQALPSAA